MSGGGETQPGDQGGTASEGRGGPGEPAEKEAQTRKLFKK